MRRGRRRLRHQRLRWRLRRRRGRQGIEGGAKSEGGAPEKIRTSDLQLRRLPLYPAELRAHLCYQQFSKMTNPTNPTKGILPDIAYGGSERSHAFNISDGIRSEERRV